MPSHPLRALRASVAVLCVLAGASLGLAVAGSACSRDTEVMLTSADSAAGGIDSGPMITVTTLAPALTTQPAERATATWAAYRLDEGDWQPLRPSSPGIYTFPLPLSRWAIAVVCASDDNALTTVHVVRRTIATVSSELSLDAQCTPAPPPPKLTLVGNLTDVPSTTQWLDFGYARSSRGVALPVSGGVAPYEVVGIEPGTWDLAFGLRDDASSALTRMVFRRGEVVDTDKTIDLGVTGPLSFAPSTKEVVLRGLVSGDSVSPHIFYAAGGPLGIDVGPQDVPASPPDPALRYSTVPDGARLPGDRYHGVLVAEHDRRTDGRTIMFDIRNAIDLDLTFLPDPPEPVVKSVAAAPQVRLETRFPVLANAVRHEVLASASINRRTSHIWHASYDAAYVAGSAEVVDTMPDLSALPGWKMEWGLPVGVEATVFATGYETPGALGDGTMQRVAKRGAMITP